MRTSLDGPTVLYGNANPLQIENSDAGPNIDYQGQALLDSRFANAAIQAPTAGPIPSLYVLNAVEALNAVPVALGAAKIAAAQALTNGGFLTLAVASAGFSPVVPLVPFGTALQPTAVPVNVAAIDFGFALGTTTTGAANTTITLTGPGTAATVAQRYFKPGQRLLIPGAGVAGAPLFTTVLATPTAAAPGQVVTAGATILVSVGASTVVTGSAIGSADPLYGISAYPYVIAGAAALLDPAQAIARAVSVTASGASSGSILVRGYDVYGQSMSESITIVGTGVASGKKAFKYISSIQAIGAGVTTGTHSIGTLDIFGIALRADFFEFVEFWANGTLVTANTGYVAPDLTSPATTTTGDVRGTYAVQTASDGTKRYVFFVNPEITQAARATNIDPRTFFGVTQA